ncbi:MAG: putative aminohydrolase SsnA [Elusimicrobiales bacterium]|nr:putative aminohydrolase SsnA [Elusimicrobiales bacterium]
MKKKIVITNGIIFRGFTRPTILKGHDIVIEDGVIKNITKNYKKSNRDYIIDASNCIVMPGFVNPHMHFYSALVKGISSVKKSKNFIEVLKNLWWKVDKALDKDSTYYSAAVSIISAIKHGVTTIIDHHAGPGYVRGSLFTIKEVVEKFGVRAALCYEVSDRDGKKIRDEGIKENEDFIKYVKSKKYNPFINAMFGLHASFTLEDDTLKKSNEIALKYGVGFHVHCAESYKDEEICMKRYGMRVVERFKKFSVTGPLSIFAHCVYVNKEEIKILRSTKTSVVVNPQSNANNAVGISDVISFIKEGILTGLGTDSMTTNMLEEARVGLWLSHLKNSNPSVGFSEIINLLHNNVIIANKFFKNIGEISEGFSADIVVFDYNPTTPINDNNFNGHLIFGISQSSCRDVICGGNILMENRKIRFIDENEIYFKSREVAEKLWKRI